MTFRRQRIARRRPRNDIPLSLKATLVDDRGVPYREFRRGLSRGGGGSGSRSAPPTRCSRRVLAGLVAWDPGWPLAVPAVLAGGLDRSATRSSSSTASSTRRPTTTSSPGGRATTRVANLLMGWLFGSSIALYRQHPLQHHRALGTTMDSENSYFDALGIRYLVGGADRPQAAAHAAPASGDRSLDARGRRPAGEAGGRDSPGSRSPATVNLAIAALLWRARLPRRGDRLARRPPCRLPVPGQPAHLLEHRSEDADPEVDYHEVDSRADQPAVRQRPDRQHARRRRVQPPRHPPLGAAALLHPPGGHRGLPAAHGGRPAGARATDQLRADTSCACSSSEPGRVASRLPRLRRPARRALGDGDGHRVRDNRGALLLLPLPRLRLHLDRPAAGRAARRDLSADLLLVCLRRRGRGAGPRFRAGQGMARRAQLPPRPRAARDATARASSTSAGARARSRRSSCGRETVPRGVVVDPDERSIEVARSRGLEGFAGHDRGVRDRRSASTSSSC